MHVLVYQTLFGHKLILDVKFHVDKFLTQSIIRSVSLICASAELVFYGVIHSTHARSTALASGMQKIELIIHTVTATMINHSIWTL